MITKVSEIKVTDISSYLRLAGELSKEEQAFLETILKVAIEYIKNYTGVDDEELDKHSDFVIVVFILCQDMYDNRCLYVDKTNINFVVSTILERYSRNLL